MVACLNLLALLPLCAVAAPCPADIDPQLFCSTKTSKCVRMPDACKQQTIPSYGSTWACSNCIYSDHQSTNTFKLAYNSTEVSKGDFFTMMNASGADLVWSKKDIEGQGEYVGREYTFMLLEGNTTHVVDSPNFSPDNIDCDAETDPEIKNGTLYIRDVARSPHAMWLNDGERTKMIRQLQYNQEQCADFLQMAITKATWKDYINGLHEDAQRNFVNALITKGVMLGFALIAPEGFFAGITVEGKLWANLFQSTKWERIFVGFGDMLDKYAKNEDNVKWMSDNVLPIIQTVMGHQSTSHSQQAVTAALAAGSAFTSIGAFVDRLIWTQANGHATPQELFNYVGQYTPAGYIDPQSQDWVSNGNETNCSIDGQTALLQEYITTLENFRGMGMRLSGGGKEGWSGKYWGLQQKDSTGDRTNGWQYAYWEDYQPPGGAVHSAYHKYTGSVPSRYVEIILSAMGCDWSDLSNCDYRYTTPGNAEGAFAPHREPMDFLI